MNADQTHTIRLPRGAAAKLRAATGQPLSRLVRFIVLELLTKYESEGVANAKAKLRGDVRETVQRVELPEGEPNAS